jgi:predicted methyltransferase
MARRAVTVEVDERLLDAARTVAERTGVPADELYERALREVLARDFAELMKGIAADQTARGVTVAEDAGLALAYEELRAARVERCDAS